MRLTIEKAEELLEKARENVTDDGWIRHGRCVGDTAAVIAKALNLEAPGICQSFGICS